MNKVFAKLVSNALNPGIVMVVGTAGLMLVEDFAGIVALIVFLLLGSLLPLAELSFGALRSKKILSRRNRYSLYVELTLSYAFVALVLTVSGAGMAWVYLSMLMSIYFGLFLLVNTYFDKASQHIGMLILWSMIWIDKVTPLAIIGFALLPLLMWSRIYLHKHTWAQFIWGSSIAMLVGLLSWVS